MATNFHKVIDGKSRYLPIEVSELPAHNHVVNDITDFPAILTLTKVDNQTLSQGNWSLVSGLYEYDFSNANITANSVVDIIPLNVDIDIVIAAQILPYVLAGSGTVKLYAKNEPTADIDVNLEIWN